MTDKELLELAAKAADIDGWFVEDDEWYGTGIVFTDENDCNRVWNPLLDDGDALRLAVKLGMDLAMPKNVICCKRSSDYKYEDDYEWFDEDYDADPYAATRRAIVRVAAEIGKDMK